MKNILNFYVKNAAYCFYCLVVFVIFIVIIYMIDSYKLARDAYDLRGEVKGIVLREIEDNDKALIRINHLEKRFIQIDEEDKFLKSKIECNVK